MKDMIVTNLPTKYWVYKILKNKQFENMALLTIPTKSAYDVCKMRDSKN